MEYLYGFIGRAVCHQIPERSFSPGGLIFPVCARCTGMYIGFLTSVIFILAFRRYNGKKPFSVTSAVVMTIGFYPMLIDIMTSYFKMRETSNMIRYLTGAVFAYAIPFFFVFLKNYRIFGQNEGYIVKLHELLILIAVSVSPYAIFTLNTPSAYYFGGALVCVSIYVLFYCVAYLFVVMIFKLKGALQKALCAFLPFLIISFLSNVHSGLKL